MELIIKNSDIDQFDENILKILAIDGRITVTELAKRVGLSKTPCQVRMKRLIDKGYITGFKAVISYKMLDIGHVAFAEVKLHNTTKKALEDFNDAIQKISEVEQCYMVAGAFDYLLKVRTKDIESYRIVLGERISALPYVASSSTFVAMQVIKESLS